VVSPPPLRPAAGYSVCGAADNRYSLGHFLMIGPIKLENPSMRFLSAFTALLLCLIPSLSFANCFSIYSPRDQLVYRSTVVPIDLSLPISEGLKVRFPNHHLVFVADESACTDIGVVANAGSGARRGASGSVDLGRLNDTDSYSIGSSIARTPGTDISVKSNTRAAPRRGN
jgi:hypothetical protein